MTTTSELQAIKAANPGFTIPGLDTSFGPDFAPARSFRSLGAADGVYYNASLNVLVVYQNGAHLSGIDFRGTSVMVQASNVTIDNSLFDAARGPFSVKVYAGYSNVTIDRSAFDGLKLDSDFADFIVSEGTGTTITNNTFVNVPNDALYIESGTVSNNYIHAGGYHTDAHSDAIWVGKTTGPVTISGNLIDWRTPSDARVDTNNAIRITSENGDVSNVTVSDNVLLGGSYSVLVIDKPTLTHQDVGIVTGVVIRDNVVDWGDFGTLYPSDRPADLVYTDNVLASGPGAAIAPGTVPDFRFLNHITGSGVADALVGSSSSNFIVGGDGTDWLYAGGGNDVIWSGSGRDYLTAGAGADIFMYATVGEAGIGATRDLITGFQVGADRIFLAGLIDMPSAAGQTWRFMGTSYFDGSGPEIRYWREGSNTVVAVDADGDTIADMEVELAGLLMPTAGNFILSQAVPDTSEVATFPVSDPARTITGADGVYAITGTSASERIIAGAGGHAVNGVGGDDVIVGGSGRDVLTGGSGRSRFVFESAADSGVGFANRDLITDFAHGRSLIDISAIDAVIATTQHSAFSWIGASAFSGAAGQLRYQVVGDFTVVQADLNGDRSPDFEIGLTGQHELVSSDFDLGEVTGSSAGSVTISDAIVVEGNSGTKLATFVVTRSGGAAAFAVNFATSDGTATIADGDYVAATGTLHFGANVGTQIVTVAIQGDIRVESDETFSITLSAATNGAVIADGQGSGTIVNDDVNHAAMVTANDVSVAANATVAASSLVAAHDQDGDAVTLFRFWDGGVDGGHFVFNNVVQQPGQWIDVAPSELGSLHYVGGPSSGSETLRVAAFDGHVWSSDATLTVTTTAPPGAPDDFNGNGSSDILWRQSDGTVIEWFMAGGRQAGYATIGVVSLDWHIAGTGDFNGDGTGDVLWRNDNGSVVSWDMKAGAISASHDLGGLPIDWHSQGVGDFNGDGRDDILWRHDNGMVAVWDMNGGQVQAGHALDPVPSSWHVQGVGDFNGDGTADILWRSDAGAVATWEMRNGQVFAVQSFGTVDLAWQAAGAGDFNGDGRDDILWRGKDGTVALWQMNGGSPPAAHSFGVVDPSWQLSGTADFNADGTDDILWRSSSGMVASWDMHDGAIAAVHDLGTVSSVFQIVGNHFDFI